MNQPILGIDLGTTYSAVAVIDEFGRPEVLLNSDSESTTPSVVFFESSDSILVGREAKRVSKVSPDDTEQLIKRIMGEQHELDHFGVAHTPESISGIILKHLVEGAFEQLHLEPEQPVRAVITVPAYFGSKEKEATKIAAEIAKLDVVALLAEPVAAALAYGVRYGTDAKTIFVYDLGGGTFDTTILKVRPDQLEVIAIDGHRRLGGADWDALLIDWALNEFKSQASPDSDPEDDEQFLQNLALDVEEAKKSLSRKSSVNLGLSFAGASLKLTLTREKLEELTGALVETTLDIVDRTIAAGQQKDPDLKIDEILLVGGSSQMSLVGQRLEERLGIKPVLNDPDLAVAKGAAFYTTLKLEPAATPTRGGSLSGETDDPKGDGAQGSTAHVVNVLPRALGIEVVDDDGRPMVDWLVLANSRLPVDTISKSYGLAQDNTTAIPIHLFEQETEVPSDRLEDNREVTPPTGAVITGLPRLPKGSPIEVQIDINHEGLASISAYEPTTGQRLKIPVQLDGLAQERIDELAEVIGAMTTS
jgi:molecular chaperone DnaK (HSP70)